MPLYDYRCDVCALEVELRSSVARRDDERSCEQPVLSKWMLPKPCGGRLVRQVSRSTSFALKGDCWAHDNYGGGQK